MRIKQIELNGFKSFMERTVLELPAGVTAIVGPNGCGKSNIVDAIRWVLGEQSPRHLRGEAMEDVIFTGNTENGPLGMAEVALLLEREEADFTRGGEPDEEGEAAADGLPPELATASEILVSRRYFCSGESEYAINRAPCRRSCACSSRRRPARRAFAAARWPRSGRWSARARTCSACKTSCASSSGRWPRSSARRGAPRSTTASSRSCASSTCA